MSEKRNYRKFTPKQKADIVLADLRGDRSVRDVCREHEIAETLDYSWLEKLLEGGQTAFAGKDEHQAEKELRRKIVELERTLGRKTSELDIAGKHCERGSESACRPRSRAGRRWPQGRRHDARASDQPARRSTGTPKPRRPPQRRPPTGEVEEEIVEVAKENPTDGYRMVWALSCRRLGGRINRTSGSCG